MTAQTKAPAPRKGQAPRESFGRAHHHHSAKPDLALLMEPVARDLLGEPNKVLSKKGELRFGTHGSLAVRLEEGDWYSHEEEVGGGVLDLIARETGLGTRHEQLTWLEEHGFREKSEPPKPPTKADEVARYRYNDEKGRPRFYVVRYEPKGQPKTFRQGRLDERGQFKLGVQGIDTRIPYHLDKLAAQPEAEVYLVEGEKHVHALEELGLVATTNAGGAGKWTDEHSRHLAGRRVVILPDNDAPGIDHARKAKESLEAAGAEVKVVMLPGLPEKGDVIDWLDAGGTLESLLEIVAQGGQELPDEDAGAQEIHPAPRPLPPSLPPVATFEEEMLPEALRGYVMDVAHRLQAPPEYCAVAPLALLAGLVGHQVRLRPKVYDDWEIVPILWAALVGGPGAMKSPAITATRFPIDAIEADARQRHLEAATEFEVEAELAELAKAAAKDKAKKAAKAGNLEGARRALEEVSEPQPPAPPARLLINDATVEKAGELMNQSTHHLTILRDELAGWLAKMQQEESAADRAFYLEAFNGDSRFTYDRIGRGTVAIEQCALNIVGGIQPSKLAPIVRGALKGTTNDGLIQRFQLAVWPDAPRGWRWIDRTPDPQAKERYAQTFYRLHALELQDEEGKPAVWRFTTDAQALFVEWATEINLRARAEETSPLLAEHMLKMPKTIGALALLFAVIDGEEEEVGVTSTARALAWADLLETHAQRIYSAATSRAIDGARVILKRRNKLPNPFKAKTVQQRGWQGLDTTEVTLAAIDLLVEHGYLTEIETPTGGRPRIDYWWHPDYAPAEGGDA